MRRIINFRPFLLTAIFALFAVGCGLVYSAYSTALGIIGGAVLLVLALVLGIISYKKPVRVFTFALCLIVSIGAFFSTTTYVANRNNVRYYQEEVSISGVVCEVTSHDTSHSVVLDNLTIDGENVDGQMRVILGSDDTSTQYLKNGYKISFVSLPITSTLSIQNGFSFGDVRYHAFTSLDYVSITVGEMSLRDNFLYSMRKTFTKWLGSEYGEVAYGIVTGDKNGIPNYIRSSYTVSGIGHILAVSGLHVGFLMGLVGALLKLLGVGNRIRPWICFPILLLYNLMVGFSFSIVRASIMFVISYIAKMWGKRDDNFNNLALAITVIVCLFPLSIFDVGFLMSVGCMLCIIFFSESITKFFVKIFGNKLYKLWSALSVSMCAQMGVFPITCYYFSSVSTYSVVANVILMPVLSFLYVFILIVGLLTMLMPFLGYVLSIAKYVFLGLDFFNGLISALPLSEIVLYGSAGIFIIYLLYFISSKFVMLKRKWIAVILCAVIGVGIVVADNIRFVGGTYIAYVHSPYDVTTLIKTDSKTVVIGDFTASCRIRECIKDTRTHSVDEVYITYLTDKNAPAVLKFVKEYGVKTVYVREDTDALAIYHLINGGANVKLTSSQSQVFEIIENGEFIGYAYQNTLFTSYKTDVESISKLYLSVYGIVRAYYVDDVKGVRFALNYSSEDNANFYYSNEDTLVINGKTFAQRRL